MFVVARFDLDRVKVNETFPDLAETLLGVASVSVTGFFSSNKSVLLKPELPISFIQNSKNLFTRKLLFLNINGDNFDMQKVIPIVDGVRSSIDAGMKSSDALRQRVISFTVKTSKKPVDGKIGSNSTLASLF